MKTKCVTSPKSINKLVNITTDLITVILLCDAPGYRMKSYGPLSLINIAQNKLIDLQIQAIQQTFINFEIILCVGFDAEKICKHIRSKYQKLNISLVKFRTRVIKYRMSVNTDETIICLVFSCFVFIKNQA